MEYRPSLYLYLVAIEKGAFGSPLTKVANLLFISVEKDMNVSEKMLRPVDSSIKEAIPN